MTLRLGNKKVCPTKLVKVNNVDWSKIGFSNSYTDPSSNLDYNYISNGSKWVRGNGAFFPRATKSETYATKFVNFSQPFEINVQFTSPTETDRNSVIFGNGYNNQYFRCPACEYKAAEANITFWFGLSTSGTTWDYNMSFSPSEIPKLPAEETYVVSSKYDGTNWIVTVKWGENNVATKSVAITGTPYYSSNSSSGGSYLQIGQNAGNGSTAAHGIFFYLGNTFVKQNDVLVWGCENGQNYIEVDPNNYLISNVTKVGAVKDNKGVLSGFNRTNYVKLPSDVSTSSANSWELIIPFRYSQVGTENQVLLGYSTYGSNRYKSPQIYLANGGIIELCLSTSGTSWDIASAASSTNTLALNMDYIAKLSFNGTEYKLEISSDDGDSFETWITVQSSTKSYGFYSTSLGTGGSGSVMFPINGSIDLNGCSLKVDGQTVWQGIVPQGTRG